MISDAYADHAADDHYFSIFRRNLIAARTRKNRKNLISYFVSFCGYFANTCEKSTNALNSSALPLGSRKNIVACSPTSP